ncbi:MAG TPA: amino acid adenylation domain-containing protein, partial [Thermoanaerobaculia bacterium]|nr:amino acid adenylation domain-containing protein [Thermoanaerobaculia bacterium]
TPNGKVDRQALPAPEWQRAQRSYLAPRTPVEEILAGIWAELLGLPRVGAADHFFDLGGHSLLATRVMSRLRAAFDVEMPLRDLFEAPTLADLAVRVEAALRAGTGRLTPPLVPMAPAQRERPLPLSFAQQRLWFIDQLEPGSPLYNIALSLRVSGPLHSAVLALCLGEVVRRHEALRTVFAAPHGAPVQVIQPAVPFVLPVVDLAGLPASRREAPALTLAGEEAGRPFDLTRGPLLRGALLRLTAGDHVAALTMHHIVSDGWSTGILIREVTALYAAFATGKPSPLPELPVQYADFAAWQHSWLHGEILADEIAFWRRQLAGLPPRLELPTDRPRPAVQSFRGAVRPVRLPAELSRQLEALSRRFGVTPFIVLLAGFQTLLARYSGQRDLAVGTPVAGRNQVEIEGAIGFFVNTLVLRGDLTADEAAGEPSFRALLGRVRETALAAHAHQDVPFEKLVQELSPERSLAQTPFFQVMFALQNAPVESLAIDNLRLRPVSGAGTTAKFDLTFLLEAGLEEGNDGLVGTLERATDLFDATTVDRLIRHYERLLTAAAAAPERRLSELPLLSEAERHQAWAEWNDTVDEPARAERCLHELFADQVAAAPERAALFFAGEALTYGELDRRADRLAGYLRRHGAGPGTRVGVCLAPSFATVIGLLAILRAGGAYVPLDPAYPAERLALLVASTPLVITREETREKLPRQGVRLICVDTEEREIGAESAARVEAGTKPGDVAYIIYTSGSTGRPKGVVIDHRGAVNTLLDINRRFGVGPGDRVLALSSLSFDLSVYDIFGLLAAGGAVVLLESAERREPAFWAELLVRHRVSIWNSVPALVEMLVEHALSDPGFAAPDLRLVMMSGDWIPVSLPDRIRGLGADLQVISMGGATEASIWSILYPIGQVEPGWPSIPYGRPLVNQAYHVLAARDGALEPQPIGVPGELFIGGIGVALGYWGDEERTRASFLRHPGHLPGLLPGGGERLYRTGDLGRRFADGTIEFLGRVDQQVKVRGFRIELGEIEAALAALAGVREAIVVVREDTPGDRRLVAYVVGDFLVDSLQESLRERLPDYMVPAAFVRLEALPLTANGKVDRKALPAPDWQDTENSYLAPRTPLEEILAGIWSELLGLERVGVEESFFDLGGHSLLATRLVSQLRDTLRLEVPLRVVFEAP